MPKPVPALTEKLAMIRLSLARTLTDSFWPPKKDQTIPENFLLILQLHVAVQVRARVLIPPPADGSVGNTNISSDPAASGNANIDAPAADDTNKKSPGDSGNSTDGNQGSTGGSQCLHSSFASRICIVLLHLSAYSPFVNVVTS